MNIASLAKDQDDFGSEVGLADMIHIDKDGVTTSEEYAPDATNKYYHGGVVQSTDNDTWWVYLEWGTAAYTDQSWDGDEFREEQDGEACRFKFVEFDDEADARNKFQIFMRAKILRKSRKSGKNDHLGMQKEKGNRVETGYIVQNLSSRARNLSIL